MSKRCAWLAAFHGHAPCPLWLRWRALNSFREDPSALPFLPTADEWAEPVDYVIKLVADHVAIGLDMVPGRTGVLADATGYPDLVAALGRITTAENIRKITGENYMRVFAEVQAAWRAIAPLRTPFATVSYGAWKSEATSFLH